MDVDHGSAALIRLRSSPAGKANNNEIFEVRREVLANTSGMMRNLIDDIGDIVNPIDLPNVDAKTLASMIEYCNAHYDGDASSSSADTVKEWDTNFVVGMSQSHLFAVISAANYLDIKPLLDLTCQRVADMIKRKTPGEIRKLFNIKNDFTPEEEEEMRRENQWAFN